MSGVSQSSNKALLLFELRKNIRSRYVLKILDRFNFSEVELLWFKENIPRVRRSSKFNAR